MNTLDGGDTPISIYTGGLKFDAEKPRYDLLPSRVMLELALRRQFKVPGSRAIRDVAMIYTAGARKYEDRNWERGMDWTRLIGASLRHLNAYCYGEEIDVSTGSRHLACVAFCFIGLATYEEDLDYAEYDDRTKMGTLSVADQDRYAPLFGPDSWDVDDHMAVVLNILWHWMGRRPPIKGEDTLNAMYMMLERVRVQLEKDIWVGPPWVKGDGGSPGDAPFIEDNQTLRSGDLKADLESRGHPCDTIEDAHIDTESLEIRK